MVMAVRLQRIAWPLSTWALCTYFFFGKGPLNSNDRALQRVKVSVASCTKKGSLTTVHLRKKTTHNYVSLFVTKNSPGTKEEKGGILALLLQVVFILIVC